MTPLQHILSFSWKDFNHLKANHIMVQHAQKIRRLLPTICLSVFDHFVGLALKGLRSVLIRLETIRGAFKTQWKTEILLFAEIFDGWKKGSEYTSNNILQIRSKIFQGTYIFTFSYLAKRSLHSKIFYTIHRKSFDWNKWNLILLRLL